MPEKDTIEGIFFYRVDDYSPLSTDEVTDDYGNTIDNSKILKRMVAQMKKEADEIRNNNRYSGKNIKFGLAPCCVKKENMLKCTNPIAYFEVVLPLNPTDLSDYNFLEHI